MMKSVGPRLKPGGTPALTGYSCEDFISRTTRSSLLLKKEEIRPNSIRLKFVKNTSMPNPVENLDISRATALAILSDTTVRRSAVDRENIKP